MRIKITKLYVAGDLAGFTAEDTHVAVDEASARAFVEETDDLHLQYILSNGKDGWVQESCGAQFVYTSAVLLPEGHA